MIPQFDMPYARGFDAYRASCRWSLSCLHDTVGVRWSDPLQDYVAVCRHHSHTELVDPLVQQVGAQPCFWCGAVPGAWCANTTTGQRADMHHSRLLLADVGE